MRNDGLSNDISLIGSASSLGDFFVSYKGAVRNISSSRVDGVFSLPQVELEGLFGEFQNGDHEFHFWHGTEQVLESAKTRVNVAYDGTPPGAFALNQPVTRDDGTRRLRWEMALGASRYQVFIQKEGESVFEPHGEERRTEFLTLDLPNGNYAAYVLAWDAAGNRTESPQIQFTLQ